jgi:thiol-disulfide isomerase/thioredoxin
MLNTISTTLHTHPYYLSLRNKVLAGNMGVGNEVPNIELPLLGGDVKQLADYRGKYVVLNFWTNDCVKSEEMFAELQSLYDIIKENKEQFVIVSYALMNDTEAWRNAIGNSNTDSDVWVHACDGSGMASPAAKLFGVEKAPKIIVVEPEGLAVTLDMDIDELIMRVEQILSGDLYYLDQEK